MTNQVTQYQSSKGPVDIATMPLSFALNARNKLQRTAPEREGEIAALVAHCAGLQETAIEKNLGNPRAVIGGNNPPEPEPQAEPAPPPPSWEAIKTHMDDLLTEAGNWADGVDLTNQDQADAVARLRQDLRDAINAADSARVAEKAPLDKQVAEIQDRYNAYIAPMKNRTPGTVSKAVNALGNLLTGWLNKLDAEKRERERDAAAKAADAAAEAVAARSEAKAGTDLSAMDAADDKLAEAEALIKQAKGVASEKVQAQGTRRAVGLRSVWIAEMNAGGGKEALSHYLKTKPDRVQAFLQSLADEDVRSGRRAIPGFTIREEKRV